MLFAHAQLDMLHANIRTEWLIMQQQQQHHHHRVHDSIPGTVRTCVSVQVTEVHYSKQNCARQTSNLVRFQTEEIYGIAS